MRKFQAKKKKSPENDSTKFKNKKVEIDGHKFDSKAESRRYIELKELAATGTIRDLTLQKRFKLIPAQRVGGRLIERAVDYVSDFCYRYSDGLIVEDVKSPFTKTPAYIIKRKLMLYVHGIIIKEVYQPRGNASKTNSKVAPSD